MNYFGNKGTDKVGKYSESLFLFYALDKGYKHIRSATKLEDMSEHWDLELEKDNNKFKLDIKGPRTKKQGSGDLINGFTFEALNIYGLKGSGYGDADFLVYDQIDKFYIFKRVDLENLFQKLTGYNNWMEVRKHTQYVGEFENAMNGKLYRRSNWGRKDCVTILTDRILRENNIATTIWNISRRPNTKILPKVNH